LPNSVWVLLLILMAVAVVIAGLVALAVRSLRRDLRQRAGDGDRISQLVRWARGNGYRYALQDATVASRFAGDPFVHDRFSYANARAWVPIRGHLMEIMEYEYYDASTFGYHTVKGPVVNRLQLVLVPVMDPALLARLNGWLASEKQFRGVLLRVENGTLISWETGYLSVDSALRQAGTVADFLDVAAR
jgi:hypothetical protein